MEKRLANNPVLQTQSRQYRAKIVMEKIKDTGLAWNGLNDVQRQILSEAGYNEDIFNDERQPALSKAPPQLDPAVWLVTIVTLGRINYTVAPLIAEYFCLDGNCGNEIGAIDAVFPENSGQLMHIFRNAVGHLAEDTATNRDLLLRTVSPDNFKFADEFGKLWFSRILENGTEVWVTTLNGVVQNGGVNLIPLYVGN